MGTQKPAYSMTVLDVLTVQDGERAGNIIISVEARYGSRSWKLPYEIHASKVDEIDLEYLKLRVKNDIEDRVQAYNKRRAIMSKLKLQVGNSIPLD